MSYSRTQIKSAPVMHCKVCASARKTPQMIASHYPKNKDGFTVCPTLLSQQCRHCGVRGHTVGYCEQKKQEELQLRQQGNKEKKVVKEQKKAETRKVQSTSFSVLMMCDSSDEEEEEVVEKKTNQATWLSALMMSSDSLEEDKKIKAPIKAPPTVICSKENQAPIKKMKSPFSWASYESDDAGSDSETD